MFDRKTQKIAAVSRAPGNLDLFVIGNDSHIGPRPGAAPLTIGTLTGVRFLGKRCLTVTRNMSQRFPGLRTILTCSSSETMVASEAAMVTSGPRPGVAPLAGTLTGARFPGKRCLTATAQKIAAVSRAPGTLDLFVIGNDSHVWTTHGLEQRH